MYTIVEIKKKKRCVVVWLMSEAFSMGPLYAHLKNQTHMYTDLPLLPSLPFEAAFIVLQDRQGITDVYKIGYDFCETLW